MRWKVRGSLVVVFTLLLGAAAADDTAGGAGSLAEAAKGFLLALRPEVRQQATFAFEHAERKDWSNVPHFAHPRVGARWGDLTDAERIAAHRLLQAGLSSQGYLKASSIMRLDDLLAETSERKDRFGSGMYFLDVFGKPGEDARWGVQVDGHHLAVHWTVVNGAMAATPAFLGTEPSEAPAGKYAGWRILGAETDKGLALVRSLSESQRKEAILAAKLPPDIFTGPGRDDALKAPAGLAAAKMNAEQTALLESLMEEYLGNHTPAVAQAYWRRIRADGWGKAHFAWMGPVEKGQPIYYRVHGPSILIEYDNSVRPGTDRNDLNHIHSVLRVPGNDFGEDLLKKHYQKTAH